MSRSEYVQRLKEIDPTSAPSPKERLPDWLFAKVMEQCGGRPSDQLMGWLETHQHTAADVSRWHAESGRPHRECGDADAILRSGASLIDHPMRHVYGKMLASMVYAFKAQHEPFLPPDFIRSKEPA